MSRKLTIWIVSCLLMCLFGVLFPSGTAGLSLFYPVISYGIPILFCVIFFKNEGGFEARFIYQKPKRFLPLILPLFPAFLLTVILLSNLTSALMANFGFAPKPMPEGNVFALIFTFALLPAVGEEILFRHIPVTVYADAKVSAVLASSLVFASAHLSIFQIPYALFSGVVFAVLDVASGSLLPSLIFHFLNNVSSILLTKLSQNVTADVTPCVLLSLFVLSLFSVVWVYIKRREYRAFFGFLGEEKSKAPVVLSPYVFSGVLFLLSLLLLIK